MREACSSQRTAACSSPMVLARLNGTVDLRKGHEVRIHPRGVLAILAKPRHDARKVDAHIDHQQQVGPPWLDLRAGQQCLF